MAASFNQTVLVGNLTTDVQLRHTPTGTAVTDVSIAVNDRVKVNGEWEDEVSFFEVTLWGRLAEVAAEYLAKGSSVLVSGKLKQERWEKDGQKRSKVKLVAAELKMLGGGSGGGGGGEQPVAAGAPAIAEDDIPF